MKKFLILLITTCSCILQGQVWTTMVDSVPNWGWAAFHNAVEDTVNKILYIGGNFQNLNQHKTKAIIRFNGTTFDTLQKGLDKNTLLAATQVRSLQMFQNKLYVFGDFARAGDYYNKYIAVWNGSNWENTNHKVNGPIDCSDIYNGELYVSGTFDSIGGIACNSVAKFDGVNWHSLSHPVKHNIIGGIKFFKGTLYMAGQVTSASSSANLSYWDGTQWIPWVGVSGNVNKAVFGLTVIDTMLYVYGRFNSIAGTNCKGLAAYNGKRWYGLGQGISTTGGWEAINNVQKLNGEIYVSGKFDKIENTGNSNFSIPLTTNLAKFDGEKWCLISQAFANDVSGVVKYKNDLYAYGAFRRIGNDSVWGFVKYNGGFTPICSPTVQIYMSNSTEGINEAINFGAVKIYPNPVNDILKIEITDFESSNVKLELMDSYGRITMSEIITESLTEINTSNLKKGIYFLKLANSENQAVFKVIKQ
ncbi:MAG: T9SS type A sorting domain-containing protein [Bacteroidia bacterium]|nr:T9SS type A sorting domain-containing protein [Bacteroidia bacterium]